MSIIVQCGHKMTFSDELMSLLNENGLKKPVKATRSGLSATEITEALDKIYIKKLSLIDNKLAESIAADFLLSNLDFDNWGWNSSKNLNALDYWKWLDSECRFILVFDHPNKLIEHAINNNLSQFELDANIKDWIEYHQVLLNFYVNNKDMCIMFEGEAALNNLKSVEKNIKSIVPSLPMNYIKISNHNVDNVKNIQKKNILKERLLNEILSQYPELLEVLKELRRNAEISSDVFLESKKTINAEDIYLIAKKMNEIDGSNQKHIINNLKDKLNKSELYIKKLELSLSDKREFNNSRIDYLKELDSTVGNEESSLQLKSNTYKQKFYDSNELEDLRKENNMILKQLYLVQKELEHNWIKNRAKDRDKDSKKFEIPKETEMPKNLEIPKEVEAPKKLEIPKATPFGVEQRIKMELPYRVGASIIENSKSRRGILTIPKAIAMEYIDYNKNITSINSLPSIEEYGDFDKAEKIKQHLSYQIGEIVAESIKEPKKIITAPIRIGNRVLSFKKAKFIQKKK